MLRRFLAPFAFLALFGAPLTLGAQSLQITGQVTDSVHRTPLADATVLATPVAPTRDTVFHSTRTDAKGRFELAGLHVGKYIVSVEHAFTDSIGLERTVARSGGDGGERRRWRSRFPPSRRCGELSAARPSRTPRSA